MEWFMCRWKDEVIFHDLKHFYDLYVAARKDVPWLKLEQVTIAYVKLPRSGNIITCIIFRMSRHTDIRHFQLLGKQPEFVDPKPCFD